MVTRPASHLRSAGEIARHISEGRLGWFRRTFGVSSAGDANLVIAWRPEDVIQEQPVELVKGLEATWRMIEDALNRWTVADLAQTYPLSYQGKNYALPRQWILWRIMAHDLHHGDELAVTLGMRALLFPNWVTRGACH